MLKSYKRRPETFKRRIIARIDTNRRDMFMEEQRWLYMIPDNQLGKKYYNVTKCWWHWSSEEEQMMSVSQKLSYAIKKKRQEDPEYCERVRLRTIEGREKSKRENPEKWLEYENIRKQRAKEAQQTLEYREKQREISCEKYNDPIYREKILRINQERGMSLKFRQTMKNVMNKPEVIAKTRLSMLGKKHTDKWKQQAKEKQRKRRDEQMIAAVSCVLDPIGLYEENKYCIGPIMQQTGLTRKQVRFMLKYYNIEFKKNQQKVYYGDQNKGSRGMCWWNNGKQNKLCLNCPGNDWKRGQLRF